MTAEVRHEMTGLLAAQVDSYAEALDQRDLARSVAVQLEQECAALEIERDAEIARANRAEAELRRLRGRLVTLRAWSDAVAGARVVYADDVVAALDNVR